MLCHLYLVSLSFRSLHGNCLLAQRHTPTWPFSSPLAEVPPHFLSLQAMQHPCNILLRTQLLHNLPLTLNESFIITYMHTLINGPFSRTTWIIRYKKNKTNLDFTKARDSEWQWHQLGHMQVCTSLQADNHASTLRLSFYRPDALSVVQPTESKHWRQRVIYNY